MTRPHRVLGLATAIMMHRALASFELARNLANPLASVMILT